MAADPQDDGNGAEGEEDDESGEHRPHRDPPPRHREGGLRMRPEARAVDRLMGEGLHGADGVDCLFRIAAQPGDGVLAVAREMADPPAIDEDRHDDDRNDEEDQRGQLGAGQEQHDEAAGEHHRVAQGLRQRRADHGLQQRRIGGQPRQDVARSPRLEIREVQGDHAVEDGAAQIGDDALADPRDQIEAAIGRDGEDDDDADQDEDGVVEQRRLAAAEPVIDQTAQPLAERQHGRRGDGEREDRAGEAQPVGANIGKDPAQGAEIARRRERIGLRYAGIVTHSHLASFEMRLTALLRMR